MTQSKTIYAPITWDEQGLPHSVVFDDKYFCAENGYEEMVHVSCEGNLLKEKFSRLDPSVKGVFTIIETGFGTGLNFCCAWGLWDSVAPKTWTLRFISIELYPIAQEDLVRALSRWPAVEVPAGKLAQQYKPLPEGMTDVYFDGGRVHLTLVFDDVVAALHTIKNQGLVPQGADAWFLNGFAPSKNPKMWSPEVFAAMAPLSKLNTSLSTFTAAGFVRRGLEEHGFSVMKIKGYGGKKHMLAGVYRGGK